MKKNIIFLLIGLFTLVSCEKEIYEDGNSNLYVEQSSPVQETGGMKLSAQISFSRDFNPETTKVGFYIAEYTSSMSEMMNYVPETMEGIVIGAYLSLMEGSDNDDFFGEFDETVTWVDEIKKDGSFETLYVPQMKQYVCIAFAMNILDKDDEFQILSSKPFFFTGEATAHLDLVSLYPYEFELSFSNDADLEVGLCWSGTNTSPNVEDECIQGYWDRYPSELDTIVVAKFDGYELNQYFEYNDFDVVYVRGYVKKYLENTTSNYESCKMIYTDVIELQVKNKESVFEINSKEDLQKFISMMSANDYMWDRFYGKVNFNYAPQKMDWAIPSEIGDTVYYEIPVVNCTITGKGIIPYVSTVSESGKISGMTLLSCYRNYGILENVSNSAVQSNYGTISNSAYIRIDSNSGNLQNSQNVYVNNNYGLVKRCIDAYGTIIEEYGTNELNRMVYVNQSAGKIIESSIKNNDEINSHLICAVNYGYIENCLPNTSCCANNYGIVKNPYVENEYEDPEIELSEDVFLGTWVCDSVYSKIIQNEVVIENTPSNAIKMEMIISGHSYYCNNYVFNEEASTWNLESESSWSYYNNEIHLSDKTLTILDFTPTELIVEYTCDVYLEEYNSYVDEYRKEYYHKVQ